MSEPIIPPNKPPIHRCRPPHAADWPRQAGALMADEDVTNALWRCECDLWYLGDGRWWRSLSRRKARRLLKKVTV